MHQTTWLCILVIGNQLFGCIDSEAKRMALEWVRALLTKPIDFVSLRNEIDMRVDTPHNLPEFAAVHSPLS